MKIPERQNLPESLDKLAAQRLLYRRAKLARNAGMALVILVVVLALIGAGVQNRDFSYGVTLTALLTWFLDQFVLKDLEAANKNEAAAVQEDFDCSVLDIPWPDHKRIKRPSGDRVRQLATRAKDNPKIVKKLEDWYTPSSIPDDETLAKVHCQRMNCWWDVDLRKKWNTVLRISFWVFVAIAILLAAITGLTVAKLLLLAASGLRIVAWGVAELKGQRSAIKNLESLHQMLEDAKNDTTIEDSRIRCFQDEILEHRRSNPPVPDWFFWINRERQEAEAAST